MGIMDKIKGLFSGNQKDNGGVMTELGTIPEQEILQGDSLDRVSLMERLNTSRNVLDNISVPGEEDVNLNNDQINHINKAINNMER